MFALVSIQRAVADAVLENIETAMRAGAKPSLEHLCRLLLTADQHDVTGLRDACLAAIAHQFDMLAGRATLCCGPQTQPADPLRCSVERQPAILAGVDLCVMRICYDRLVSVLAVHATGSRDAAVLGTFIQAVAPHIHTVCPLKGLRSCVVVFYSSQLRRQLNM